MQQKPRSCRSKEEHSNPSRAFTHAATGPETPLALPSQQDQPQDDPKPFLAPAISVKCQQSRPWSQLCPKWPKVNTSANCRWNLANLDEAPTSLLQNDYKPMLRSGALLQACQTTSQDGLRKDEFGVHSASCEEPSQHMLSAQRRKYTLCSHTRLRCIFRQECTGCNLAPPKLA